MLATKGIGVGTQGCMPLVATKGFSQVGRGLSVHRKHCPCSASWLFPLTGLQGPTSSTAGAAVQLGQAVPLGKQYSCGEQYRWGE